MNRVLFFIIILILSQKIVMADYLPINKIKHINKDDGLSSNQVNCILQDSKGLVWFGTEDGLNRYDGYEIKIYKHDNDIPTSLPSSIILTLLEDINNKDNIWIGTRKGLVYFNQKHQTFKLVLSAEFVAPRYGTIRISSLCFDADSNLWIGTYNGLYILNTKTHKYIKSNYIPKNKIGEYGVDRIRSIYKDRNDNMWVGYRYGMLEYNYKDSTFTPYISDVNIGAVTSIMQDYNNDFWIGTSYAGWYKINKHPKYGITKEFLKKNLVTVENSVCAIIENKPGELFVIIEDRGLFSYNIRTDIIKQISYNVYNGQNNLNSEALTSAYKSKTGTIWIGTYNKGVNYFKETTKSFELYRYNFRHDGLLNNNIRALFEDSENNIWIGTKENGGLSKFNREKETFKNYIKSDIPGKLNDDYIYSIGEWNKDTLLIGTYREGLALFDKRRETFKYFNHESNNKKSLSDNNVYLIHIDSKKHIWIGNYSRLMLFDIKKGEFNIIPNINKPRCMHNDGDTLWIGSQCCGLYMYNSKNKKIINYTHKEYENSLSNNNITFIVKDKFNNLWIATKNGLNRFNIKSKKFKVYTEKDGLSSNWIASVLVDDENNIWVGTNSGLSKLDIKTDRFINFDKKDGLQGNEFANYVAFKTHDGILLFGGANGLNMFNPKEIKLDTTRVKCLLEKLYIDDKEINIGDTVFGNQILQNQLSETDEIVLSYKYSTFSILFSGLYFLAPEKVHYRFKLKGYDDKWRYTNYKNRIATYTNIKKGDYVFMLETSGENGEWTPLERNLKIKIIPPWWNTSIFYFLLILFIITLLIGIYRIRIRVISKQKKVLEQIVDKRTKELVKHREELEKRIKERTFELEIAKDRAEESDRLKSEFLANMSHEIRTPLNAIVGFSTLIAEGDLSDIEVKEYSNIVESNSNTLLTIINDIVDISVIEAGQLKITSVYFDVNKIMIELEDIFKLKNNNKEVDIEFINKDKLETFQIYNDEVRLKQIMVNLLDNALKFTNKGFIKFGYNDKGSSVEFFVQDTGIGISPKEKDKAFEYFHKVSPDKNKFYSGTGLGLTISKKLVAGMGGEIKLLSEVGVGTKFTFTILRKLSNG